MALVFDTRDSLNTILTPLVTSAGDGLKAKVPFSELDFITFVDKNALTTGSNTCLQKNNRQPGAV
jgi:hypothetical protein